MVQYCASTGSSNCNAKVPEKKECKTKTTTNETTTNKEVASAPTNNVTNVYINIFQQNNSQKLEVNNNQNNGQNPNQLTDQNRCGSQNVFQQERLQNTNSWSAQNGFDSQNRNFGQCGFDGRNNFFDQNRFGNPNGFYGQDRFGNQNGFYGQDRYGYQNGFYGQDRYGYQNGFYGQDRYGYQNGFNRQNRFDNRNGFYGQDRYGYQNGFPGQDRYGYQNGFYNQGRYGDCGQNPYNTGGNNNFYQYMTKNPSTGNLSLDSGMEYSKNSIAGLDYNKDSKISIAEADSLGSTIKGSSLDLDKNGYISPGENLSLAIHQDTRYGQADGMVTPWEASATDMQYLQDKTKVENELLTIYTTPGANNSKSLAERDKAAGYVS